MERFTRPPAVPGASCGATSFDATSQTRGLYFFDEFDAIGSQRGLANDVGEIRRVLNSFLQMIEQDRSHSLIVSATNHPGILDTALFRRFDDVFHYELPDEKQVAQLLEARLGRRMAGGVRWEALAAAAAGLSCADIVQAANEAFKEALIHDRQRLWGRWTLKRCSWSGRRSLIG